MRRLSPAYIVFSFLVALFAPSDAWSAAVIEVDYGSDAFTAPYAHALRAELEGRLIRLLGARELTTQLRERVLLAPNPDRDAAFLRDALVLPSGRNQYFEQDFEGSVATLAPVLASIEADPSLLAFHPDLVPSAFECFLVLVRALDVLEREEDAEATLERVVRLFHPAVPDELAFDEGFLRRVEGARARVLTRTVAVSWAAPDGARLLVNGSQARVERGGTLLLPEGDAWAQVSIGGRASHVYRVPPEAASWEFDAEFDDAIAVDGEVVQLRSRSTSTADNLQRLGRGLGHALSLDEVFTVGVVPAGTEGPATLEMGRWVANGETFRAVRMALEPGSSDTDVRRALTYLLTGEAEGPYFVWQEVPGWIAVDEDGRLLDPRRGEPSDDAGADPRFWALVPGSLTLIGAGLSLLAGRAVEDASGELEECRFDDACRGTATLADRRDELDRRETLRWIGWTGTGVAALATAGVLLLAGRSERAEEAQTSRWRPYFDGRTAGVLGSW